MKTKFFNNISHEFRTPLTLIQGPVEDLVANARLNKKEHNKLQMISRNTGRLLNLVNQLLDIAKLDNGKIKLKLGNGDILQSLRIIAGSFSSLAETRGIIYNRSIPMGKYNTWFDFGILEKIAVNLLSNAFKFTPEAGEVTIRARWFHGETIESPDQIEFSVSDQGPGIPENSMDKIFTRFYQLEGESHQKTAGTGIGLSLVRDLVKLNHGEIKVESEIGKGSTFIVRLPLGKDHLKENEFVLAEEKEEIQPIAPEPEETIMETSYQSGEMAQNKKGEEKPIVLIVEDNNDIRSHISENLENEYQLFESVNGRAGLIKAQEIIPDLVITDLIMPFMDGTELCRQLKNDERTSHIPIIMLTAKSSLEDKLEGLETGADDYLSKPFHMKELLTRISNLIEQRRRLRERFSKEITLEPSEISITSLDEEFLKRAIDIVEKHL
ncbi:MAG: response regulator, partial [Cyclobacteriaceae bacterium]|nr:response regulator [Cyclobacteriaceae bacterium]